MAVSGASERLLPFSGFGVGLGVGLGCGFGAACGIGGKGKVKYPLSPLSLSRPYHI